MTKFSLVCIFVTMAFASVAQEQMFEHEGVYYQPKSTDSDGVVNVNVAVPKDFVYQGDVRIDTYFTRDGQKYKVDNNISSAFANSKIKNFVCGLDNAEYRYGHYISLLNDKDLERIQFMYPRAHTGGGIDLSNNINLGNNPGCVYLYMHEGETENTLTVDKFNVFGPDGERLKPRLMVEESGELIYPDENNVFHLDTEWRWKGEYCMVLKLSAYYVVYLFGETADGKLAEVRVQPAHGQSGLSTVYEGMKYSINNDHAELHKGNSDDIEGELIIPASIPYEGRQLPVTTIGPDAFSGYSISSVTLPSSITTIGSNAFSKCTKLVKADLSAIASAELYATFSNCEELSEVILPQTDAVLALSGTFNGCKSLTSCKIPRNALLSSPFSNSGVINYELSGTNDTDVNIRISKFDVLDMDGQKLPFSIYKNYNDYSKYESATIVADMNGDIFTFPRSAFYNIYPDGQKIYNGSVAIGIEGINCDYLGQGSTFAYFTLKETDFSGVEEIVCDADGQEEYYNLQGLQVQPDALTPGIYIKRKGKTTSKIFIR